MAKRYIDQLAEWVEERDASRRRQDKNLVAFLAVRTDVKEAMDAGYALKTIWEHLYGLGKIPHRYETFLKHVHRHIEKTPTVPEPGTVTQPNQEKDNKPDQKPVKATGFTFDATPKKEDLI